jgi:hypothetical protein
VLNGAANRPGSEEGLKCGQADADIFDALFSKWGRDEEVRGGASRVARSAAAGLQCTRSTAASMYCVEELCMTWDSLQGYTEQLRRLVGYVCGGSGAAHTGGLSCSHASTVIDQSVLESSQT